MLLSYNATTFISNIDTKINMSKQETAKQKEEQKSKDKALSEIAAKNLSELDLR